MHFLFMCHAVGMGAGELTPVTGNSKTTGNRSPHAIYTVGEDIVRNHARKSVQSLTAYSLHFMFYVQSASILEICSRYAVYLSSEELSPSRSL